MEFPIEMGKNDEGMQTTRIVTDVINNCNLGCHYCHPKMGGWGGEMISATQVGDILQAAEDKSLLEVTLTGGEITIHPEFSQIMEETHRLGKTALSMVTNATKITPQIVTEIANSRVDRVCVSVDGPDAESHNSRRGRNFDTVMSGLRDLQDTGKSITVISVVHKQNHKKLPLLTQMLASEGLADQHHLCAACYSGSAKRIYDRFALSEDDFHSVQESVDDEYEDLKAQNFHVTFNSYWPAMGLRGNSAEARTMTLVQFSEQIKNIYGITRPDGDVRLTVASWGRETIGNAVIGNLHNEPATVLLSRMDETYRSGQLRQIPREIEAGHKFHVGPYNANFQTTNKILEDEEATQDEALRWEPVHTLAETDLLQNPLDEKFLDTLAAELVENPTRTRIVRHASGVDVVFNRETCHMTVLRPSETETLRTYFERQVDLTTT